MRDFIFLIVMNNLDIVGDCSFVLSSGGLYRTATSAGRGFRGLQNDVSIRYEPAVAIALPRWWNTRKRDDRYHDVVLSYDDFIGSICKR